MSRSSPLDATRKRGPGVIADRKPVGDVQGVQQGGGPWLADNTSLELRQLDTAIPTIGLFK